MELTEKEKKFIKREGWGSKACLFIGVIFLFYAFIGSFLVKSYMMNKVKPFFAWDSGKYEQVIRKVLESEGEPATPFIVKTLVSSEEALYKLQARSLKQEAQAIHDSTSVWSFWIGLFCLGSWWSTMKWLKIYKKIIE